MNSNPRAVPRLLILAQTPPPVGGQTLLTERLLSHLASEVDIRRLDPRWSTSYRGRGRPSVWKLLRLIYLELRLVLERMRGLRVLYYCPSCNGLGPMVRDALLLSTARLLGYQVVLHFHATGLGQALLPFPRAIQRLILVGYGSPVLSIHPSRDSASDGLLLKAAKVEVVLNGVIDVPSSEEGLERIARRDPFIVLYIGLLSPRKGLDDLLRAFGALRRQGNAQLHLAGEFESKEYEQDFRQRLAEDAPLAQAVELHGLIRGQQKAELFRRADLLCFPTKFESESFGLVAAEGMAWGLPVVATRWRGLPEVVEHGVSGLLVAPGDVEALSSSLLLLMGDDRLRQSMGIQGRARYERLFRIERWEREVSARLREVLEALSVGAP